MFRACMLFEVFWRGAQIGASLRVYKTIRTALKNAALIRSGKI